MYIDIYSEAAAIFQDLDPVKAPQASATVTASSHWTKTGSGTWPGIPTEVDKIRNGEAVSDSAFTDNGNSFRINDFRLYRLK